MEDLDKILEDEVRVRRAVFMVRVAIIGRDIHEALPAPYRAALERGGFPEFRELVDELAERDHVQVLHVEAHDEVKMLEELQCVRYAHVVGVALRGELECGR